MPCKKSAATRVLVLLKSKVLTPGQEHASRKLAQELLHRERKQFQYLLSIALSVHINDLNVTPVHGGLQSLQHVGVNFIRMIFKYVFDEIVNSGCSQPLLESELCQNSFTICRTPAASLSNGGIKFNQLSLKDI
jgi:hypothetical protein